MRIYSSNVIVWQKTYNYEDVMLNSQYQISDEVTLQRKTSVDAFKS